MCRGHAWWADRLDRLRPIAVRHGVRDGMAFVGVTDYGGGWASASADAATFLHTTNPPREPTYTYSRAFGSTFEGLGMGLPLAALHLLVRPLSGNGPLLSLGLPRWLEDALLFLQLRKGQLLTREFRLLLAVRRQLLHLFLGYCQLLKLLLLMMVMLITLLLFFPLFLHFLREVGDLRAELEELGEATDGKKGALVTRLVEAQRAGYAVQRGAEQDGDEVRPQLGGARRRDDAVVDGEELRHGVVEAPRPAQTLRVQVDLRAHDPRVGVHDKGDVGLVAGGVIGDDRDDVERGDDELDAAVPV